MARGGRALGGLYEVPQDSPVLTSTDLDDMNVNQYFSRLIPSASDAGTAQADYYLTRPGLGDLGVLFNSDP